MSTLILIGVAVVLLLIIIVLLYRSKAQQAMHFCAIQKTIAEAALSQNRHREKLDNDLSTLEAKQRQETIDENQPTILARRDGLDNHWSDDVGVLFAAPSTTDTDSAASADSAGSTVHFVNRPDLC